MQNRIKFLGSKRIEPEHKFTYKLIFQINLKEQKAYFVKAFSEQMLEKKIEKCKKLARAYASTLVS